MPASLILLCQGGGPCHLPPEGSLADGCKGRNPGSPVEKTSGGLFRRRFPARRDHHRQVRLSPARVPAMRQMEGAWHQHPYLNCQQLGSQRRRCTLSTLQASSKTDPAKSLPTG